MWQQELLDRLTSVVAETPAISSVRAHGSVVTGDMDRWSDLDVELTVQSDRLSEVFPDPGWLAPIGSVYASSTSFDERSATLRLIFENLQRLDLRFVPASGSWRPVPSSPVPMSAVDSMTSDFLFEAMLATFKIARNDLLISGHLVLGLERKVLELAMMLRDRDLGTSYHRYGGLLNETVMGLTVGGFDTSSLLSRIESAARVFDTCARQFEPKFNQNWAPLLGFIGQVRASSS